MVFKRFRFVVLLRIIFLSATLCLFLYLFFGFETRYYATIFIVGLIIVYQVYALIHYVEKTNRDLNRFLQTIKHEDFSQTFLGQGLGSSFEDLKSAFNDVIQKFHKARAEKEEHFRYLQTVVQHVGIGLLAFESDGKVELINTAAKRLLKKPALKNITALKAFSEPLVETLLEIQSGQRALVKIHDNNEMLQLAINATEFRMRDQNFKLVTLQDIQSELEETELQAWQKLIRVLTHEIMNSVTPIASLASTIKELIESEDVTRNGAELKPESKEDIQGGLQTIQKRSEGLLHFVDAYRDLTRIPTPNFQIFAVKDLLERVVKLMQNDLSEKCISCEIRVVPENLQLTADSEMIEQILINLLKNAMHAVADKPDGKIMLSSEIDARGHAILQVSDNGPGIPEDVREKIFIPFFTTKENGSGIGLSLSQQVMRLHGGSIGVQSRPNESTTFTLRF